MTVFKTLLREPLLYFLIGGALLYLLFEAFGANPTQATALTLDQEDWHALKSRYRIQNDKADEMLQEQLIFEKIMQREARILEIDRQDSRIETRLLELMTALLAATPDEPSQEELRTFYAAHPELYGRPERLSILLLELPVAQRDWIENYRTLIATFDHNVSQALAFATATGLAKPIPKQTPQELEGTLGAYLAKRLLSLSPYRWYGPIEMPSKVYFCYISAYESSEILDFEEVIERVYFDALWARRMEQLRDGYARMRSQYRIERR